MRIEIIKGKVDDRIVITRMNGERVETRFPKKGPLPHDAVHVIVERAFGLSRGFWGMIAEGAHPESIAKLAAGAGHPSAKRAPTPNASIVELIQAERLVECFEAECWGAPAPLDTLQSVADAAMAQSCAPSLPLDAAAVAEARAGLAALGRDWAETPPGGAIAFDWPEPA